MIVLIIIVIIKGAAITITKKSEGSLHERDISIIAAAMDIRAKPIKVNSSENLFRKMTSTQDNPNGIRSTPPEMTTAI
jgi:hypothetical protein